MGSLIVNDPNLDNKEQRTLADHMKSIDFFATDEYDEIVFKIQKSSIKDGSGQVTGIIALKGMAFGMFVPTKISFSPSGFKAVGDFSIGKRIHEFIGEDYGDTTPEIDIAYHITATKLK